MLTNRISVDYNMENIDADFDILESRRQTRIIINIIFWIRLYMNLRRQQFSGPSVQQHWCCSVRVR